MWFRRYLPLSSESSESSPSALPSCKNCVRKRWLLSIEGLLAAGGLAFGTRVALKGQPEWVITACTTGSLCICLANSILLHFPATKPSSWVTMFTGGILSGAGIGWCLTVAFKEQPKSIIAAYLAGAISICLTNSIMFHVPSWYESIQTKESLTKGEVTDQSGVHLKPIIDPSKREKSMEKKSSYTSAGVDEKSSENTSCSVEFSVDKGVLQSEPHDVVTSGIPVGNVSESLELHQEIKRPTLAIPTQLDSPKSSCETTPKRQKNKSPRISVSSRFQGMGSSIASIISSSTDTAAVMPVDRHVSGQGDEASVDEVVVKDKSVYPE